MDGSGMTFRGQAGADWPVHAFNLEIAIIEGVREMGRGHLGHAPCKRTVIDDHDSCPCPGQAISAAQAGDARTDNADIGMDALSQLRKPRRFYRRRPDEFRLSHLQSCSVLHDRMPRQTKEARIVPEA